MKRLIACALFYLGITISAAAQTESAGSFAVAEWSKNEIVIAADSREIHGNTYCDCSCKISAFGNKVIFTATGRTTPGLDRQWNAYALAAKQFQTLTAKGTPERVAQRLASVWGESVKQEFERLGDGALTGLDNNYISSGLFADFEKDGTLLIVIAQITYERRPAGTKISALTKLVDLSLGNYSLGHADVINQLNATKTKETSEWMDQLQRKVRGSKDEVAAEAIGVVDLTIEHLSKDMFDSNGSRFSVVGPPTAAVRLIRGKGVEWVQRGKCNPHDETASSQDSTKEVTC